MGATLALTALMRPVRRLSAAVLCALPITLGASPVALAASDFEKVVTALITSGGVLPPCKFTSQQLTSAKASIPADYAQYAPDFKDAVDAALKQRASGACEKKPSGAKAPAVAAPVAPPTGGGPAGPTATPTAKPGTKRRDTKTTAAVPAKPTPQPTPSVRPAPAIADGAILAAAKTGSDNEVPAPLVALAIVALLSALAALAVLSARWFAFEPAWVERSRHATAEAGWRTSAAWADLRDRLRFGR